jgi:hypothetical protein
MFPRGGIQMLVTECFRVCFFKLQGCNIWSKYTKVPNNDGSLRIVANMRSNEPYHGWCIGSHDHGITTVILDGALTRELGISISL